MINEKLSVVKNTDYSPVIKLENTGVKLALIVFSVMIMLCIIVLPLAMIFVEAFSKGLSLFIETLFSDTSITALWFSIMVTTLSVLCSTIFGICAAWCIAYFDFRGKRILTSLIDLPISISPIIIGLMFMLMYGKYSLIGRYFENMGIVIIFALPGLILTNMSITLPYVARALIPAMQELGKEQEEMAYLLGANGLQILLRITLPRIKWALLYGIILATARGAGEFGAASVVSGFIRGKTVTLPLQVHVFYSEYLSTQAFISATLFVLLSIFTLGAKYIVGKHNKG